MLYLFLQKFVLFLNSGSWLPAVVGFCVCKKKNTFIVLLSITVLFFCTCTKNSLLLFEITGILSVMIGIKHNSKCKMLFVCFLIVVLLGCFFISIYQQTNAIFLTNTLSVITKQNIKPQTLVCLFLLFSFFCIIGFVPFTEWVLHLHSISTADIKTFCLTIPLIMFLQNIQAFDLFLSNNILLYCGVVVSFYTAMFLLFETKQKNITTLLGLFAFGLQIISTFYQLQNKTFYFFILASSVLLILQKTPIIQKKQQTFDVKQKNTLLSFLSFCLFYSVIISCLLLLKSKNKTLTTLLFVFFIVVVSKTKNILLQYNTHKQYLKIQKGKTISLLGCFVFFVLYIHKNKNIFDTTNVLDILICIGGFVCVFVLSKILSHKNKPKILQSKIYYNINKRFTMFVFVFWKITKSVFCDFFLRVKTKMLSFLTTKTINNFAEILYNNNILFYAFFLTQLIIILLIECVIT